MRFSRFDLKAFGHFTDRTVEFPARKHDLHIIVGPNEAGKSTLRDAMSNYLFGIPSRTPYNFLHGYPDLCLGAQIEEQGRQYEWLRFKRNKETLLHLDGSVAREAELGQLLGSIAEAQFRQAFCLDVDGLEAGASALLDPTGDAGSALFEAASGLKQLAVLRARLESEASELLGRGNNKRPFALAEQRMRAAAERLKSVQMSAAAYREIRSKLSDAEQVYFAAKTAFAEAGNRQTRLNRIRAVRVPLARLETIDADLAALGEVALLADNAHEIFEQATVKLTHLSVQRDQLASRLTATKQTLSLAAEPGAIIEHAEEIDALYEALQQDARTPGQLAEQEREYARLCREFLALTSELPWRETEVAGVIRRLPSKVQIGEYAALLSRHEACRNERDNAVKQNDRAARRCQELKQELASIDKRDVPPSLEAAIAEADLALGLHRKRGEARKRVEQLEQILVEALSRVPGWTAGADVLAEVLPPDAAVVQALRDEIRSVQSAGRELERRRARACEQGRALDVQIEGLRQSGKAVSMDEIIQARAARDALWASIRSGSDPAAQADRYEEKLQIADTLADQRADHAEQVAQLEARLEERRRLAGESAEIAAELEICTRHLDELEAQWPRLRAASGLPEISIERFGSWLERRQAVLSAMAELQSLGVAQSGSDQELEAARARLTQEASAAGVPKHAASITIEALLERSRAFVSGCRSAASTHEEKSKSCKEAQRAAQDASDELASADKALAAWSQAWDRLLEKIGLPADTSVDAGKAYNALLGQLIERANSISEIKKDRIEPMRVQLASLADAVALAGAKFAVEGSPDDIFAWGRNLKAALDSDREAALNRKRLAQTILECESEIDEKDRSLQAAKSDLAALFDAAGIQPGELSQLRAAIEASDRYRDLLASQKFLTAEVLQNADGRSLEALREECAGFDPDTLQEALAQIEQQSTEAYEAVGRCQEQLTQARAAYGAIDTDGAAAQAEAERQAAYTDMAEIGAKYARVRTAYRLLSAGLEIYRQQHQGPLLEAASKLFIQLTGGRYERLDIDFDSNELHAVQGRQRKGTAALSEGTRNQLYLALRMAALSQQIEAGRALPFIADDLLMTFDPERSAAAFTVLHKLSAKTQVIYLTHHPHMADIAKSALSDDVNVIALAP